MRHALKTTALAVVALIAASGARAADDWQAEWKKTIAAAEKEGTLVLNIPPSNTHRDFLQKEWAKDFPNIKLSASSVDASAWMQRVRIERGSGKYLWDALLSGSVTTFQVKNDGFTVPIQPELILPDVKDPKTWGGWEKVFYDKDRKYVFATRNFLKMPFYNAKQLSPEKVKSMGTKVFLDPSLKGKIVWHDPLIPGSGESFAPVFRHILGDDGLKTFVQQQVVFLPNMMDMVEKMARGQYTIGMGPVMTGLLVRYKNAGLDIDIRPLGNTPEYAAYSNTGGSNLVIMKDRPNPNATKVFVNWYLSKDVATRLAQIMAEDSSREDIPDQVPPDHARVKGANYLEPQREEQAKALHDSHAVIKKYRSEMN
jgi:ABC-type Fe3+ transport system substrate-binding protein